jgi:hypothetical protein
MAGHHHREGAVKNLFIKLFKGLMALCGVLVLCLVALVGMVLYLLRPGAGEWSHTLQWGPWKQDVSVQTLVRMATHPVMLDLLEDRTFKTSYGVVQWHKGDQPGTWQAVCAPCVLQREELGSRPIRLTRAEFTVGRDAQWNLHGSFTLGDGAQAVRGRWTSHMKADGAELKFSIVNTPLAHAFGLFAQDIPELGRARIEGRISLDARLQLPSRQLTLQPRIEDFSVAGLGTEALLNAEPPCAASNASASFGTWLPRAVMAAEDQRFHQHTGYDLTEINAAWSINQQQGETARGASTLSQQLAKLVYTGSERSHVRKLRELLYAVELDRTLGKARVLHLYLAMAPWGGGQCGAHAAARHYFNKRADALTPTEAAWLASLLHSPNGELARMAQTGRINTQRVAWVLHNLRPMRPERRQALADALPGWMPQPAPDPKPTRTARRTPPLREPAPTRLASHSQTPDPALPP